ncbi:Oidioi.mRNA.OKI2018_I69.chr1.g1649.t1.cds [Oikopleura dioica]|uniref:Oidioi.mRNA.OKI2018_I69.chr1.g1649.t1.cds n=1 Tax=Oikopleura dioica TaxID=34765 RepID=A0ABN7SST2_OIKDI|nr:Oidioi.mRNA.OKI2018_I69.chr1.g1649.t1.cds [Oikopleura dioica]
MRSRIDEAVVSVEEATSLEEEKHTSLLPSEEVKESLEKRAKGEPLANVKCLECHCVGTVMKAKDQVVLRPNTVKKTLIDLGGGFFMPNIDKVKPTVKTASQKAKKFIEGFKNIENDNDDGSENGFFKRSIKEIEKFRERFARGVENARSEKETELMNIMEGLEREETKTPPQDNPCRFTGFFSDEFEGDNFWKSKKRFAFQ